MSLRVMLGVQQPAPDELAPPANGDAVADASDEDAPSPSTELSPLDDDGSPEDGSDVASEDDASGADAAETDDELPDRPERPRWMTLGSMDPESGFHMLVTLNSRGGAVERIELTERKENGRLKYRRVDVRGGYLGYFSGEPASAVDGVLVNVVGPGTPAAWATAKGVEGGIQAGDVIVAVNGSPGVTPEGIRQALIETEAGDEVTVEVIRRGEELGASTTDELAEAAVEESPESAPTILAFTTTLTEHPLDLVRLAKYGGADQIRGNLSRLSCLLTLGKVNRKSIGPDERAIVGLNDPGNLVWDAQTSADADSESAHFSVEMTQAEMAAVGGDALAMQRSYTLPKSSYAIDMAIQIDNKSDENQQLAYRLEGVNGLTLEGWWYSNKISPNWGGAAARDIVYKTAADGHELISGYNLLERAQEEPGGADQVIFAPDSEEAAKQLAYIGVDAQYFTVAYLPPAETNVLTSFARAAAGIVAAPELIPENKERAVNTFFFLDSVTQDVPPDTSFRQNLRIYAGPKDPEILAAYGLGDTVYYGWFAPAARVLASLLHLLQNLVGNYGVAIVLLTVLVRGLMFPLSRKAAVNAQRMQELAPELKKIAEKYKDDMEGRLKAQRELQQRVGFNPLAGCLPMFLQLPIFIGLYRALSVDIELRQAAISSATSWASNLAGPDMLAYWGDWLWDYLSGRGTGWLGPYFNILPVIVVLLFLAQQKMFMPPATDEQTAMTQKVMNVMTLVMGLFFFRVPAGLCIYFITSSLWGICERVLVKKTLPTQKHFGSLVLEGNSAPVAKDSSNSLAERLRQRISPPETPAERPNKRKRPPAGKKKP